MTVSLDINQINLSCAAGGEYLPGALKRKNRVKTDNEQFEGTFKIYCYHSSTYLRSAGEPKRKSNIDKNVLSEIRESNIIKDFLFNFVIEAFPHQIS